jgi:hypothetical protein
MMRPCQVCEEEQGKEGAIAEGQVVVVENSELKFVRVAPKLQKGTDGVSALPSTSQILSSALNFISQHHLQSVKFSVNMNNLRHSLPNISEEIEWNQFSSCQRQLITT